MSRSPIEEAVKGLSDHQIDVLFNGKAAAAELIIDQDWEHFGRPEQQPPPGDWYIWLILAGRGWGKTRTGAEWMAAKSKGISHFRGALVGATSSDARDVMVEGESGLLSVLPPSRLLGGSVEQSWNRSLQELKLADGSYFKVFTAEKPDRLRGPQLHAAWCDELSSWQDAHHGLTEATNTTFSNLRYACRLGDTPQIVITTTPKPNALTRQLVDPETPLRIEITKRSTFDNLQNLAPAFLEQVVRPTEGTRLGRQELFAEILEDVGEFFDVSWLIPANDPMKGRVWRARYWDLAGSEPSESHRDPDWTRGTLGAMNPENRNWRIESMVSTRSRPGSRNDLILETAKRDVELYGRNVRYWVEQEPGSGGIAQVEELARLLEPVKVVVKGQRPTGDKVTRAEPVAAAMEQGRVSVVIGAWNGDMYDELREFPNGAHDDVVDTLSGLWAVSPGHRTPRLSAPLGERRESLYGVGAPRI